MKRKLRELGRCFQGIWPAIIATCDRDGLPNVTYLSQVFAVDARHVALSRQFFNKTSKNVEQNPYASVVIYDPVTLESNRLDLKYVRSETTGPLFESMSVRIQAIASQTGMAGVFKLISADVYEVLDAQKTDELQPQIPAVEEDEAPPQSVLDPVARPRTELRGLAVVSERINRARDLDELLSSVLAALRDAYGFEHSMILLPDEKGERLFTVASLGYGESGVGAEVAIGEGLIGTAAKERTFVRVAAIDEGLRYGRAIRKEALSSGQLLRPEIPLPGLPDAKSHLAIPLVVDDRLVGVLSVESRAPLGIDEWHEGFLGVAANQVAIAIERMQLRAEETGAKATRSSKKGAAKISEKTRSFVFYKNDDCVFVDGDYLIRNVPGRILWKILRSHVDDGRIEFTNRELRMDASLGLPAVKDNLESRLILLRKRLEERCEDVRLVSIGRGQFRLDLGCGVDLVEKDSP